MAHWLHPQAAVIRQDSILESFSSAPTPTSEGPVPGSQSGPRFSRSMSRDTGLDASGDVVLQRHQVDDLQEQVKQLRLKGSGPDRKEVEQSGRRRSNGEVGAFLSPPSRDLFLNLLDIFII